jgi:predicted metal-dependent HD superfamily phosphohydrolase
MKIAETFKSLVTRYNNNPQHAGKLWEELVKNYSESSRYYHTLDHLQQLLKQILPYKDQISDFDAVLFALYYHDVVYNIFRKDNEEASAVLAEKRLITLNVPKERIEVCKRHILATKAHISSDDADTNLFTDADLSILGADWNTYQTYHQQVRKEYSVYPDLLYKPGRKKVLKHFLGMEKIFKTEPFITKYEHQARINLERELNEL